MTEKTLPVYLSLEEAAEVMSLSVKTIRRRIADGTIPPTSAGDAPPHPPRRARSRTPRIPSARW